MPAGCHPSGWQALTRCEPQREPQHSCACAGRLQAGAPRLMLTAPQPGQGWCRGAPPQGCLPPAEHHPLGMHPTPLTRPVSRLAEDRAACVCSCCCTSRVSSLLGRSSAGRKQPVGCRSAPSPAQHSTGQSGMHGMQRIGRRCPGELERCVRLADAMWQLPHTECVGLSDA